MKFKSTWLLLALFAGLGAYLYFVDEPRQRAKDAAEEGDALLFPGLDPAKVTELSLDGPRGRVRAVRGEGDLWSLTEPLQDAADEGRIRSLLEDLRSLKGEKEAAPAGVDLAPFGLDAPEQVVRTRGSEALLSVGAENPAGDGRYVRAGSGAVWVAKSPGMSGFLIDPADLRSKDLLPGFPWPRLRSLEVGGPGREALRLRKDGQRWLVEGPKGGEADPEAVEALEEKLRGARAAAFVQEASAGARLAKGVTVTLGAEGRDEPAVVRLLPVGEEVWAGTSAREAVFTVAKEVLEALRPPPERFLRRRPALAKAWSVEKLEVAAGSSKLAYDKANGTWRRGAATVAPKEFAALEALLRAVEEAKARRLVRAPGPAADYGLAAPAATLDLTDSLHGRQTVAVGKKGDAVYARAGDAGPVYEMPADYLESVEALVAAAASPGAAPESKAARVPGP